MYGKDPHYRGPTKTNSSGWTPSKYFGCYSVILHALAFGLNRLLFPTKPTSEFRPGVVIGHAALNGELAKAYAGFLGVIAFTSFFGTAVASVHFETITYDDGGRYEGHIRFGKLNGTGSLTFPTGDTYVGEFKNDLRHGEDKYTWTNGEYYEGEFKNGDFNGNGGRLYSDGATYYGYWKNDLRHGKGTYVGPDIDSFAGEWKEGKKHGYGRTKNRWGKILQEGYWIDNKYVGKEKPASL